MTTRSLRPHRALIAGVVGISLSVASLSIASSATTPRSVNHGSAAAARSSASWAGYVATARSPFTGVSALWTVEPVVCVKSASHQAVVQWVGFDGWSDKTVEQGGTEAYCSGNTPLYSAWWEMYPSNQITQVFAVHPGDQIAASVSSVNRVFTIVVHDLTTNKALTIAQTCKAAAPCARTSAEWIVEAPSYAGRGAALPRWSQLHFTQARASVSTNTNATSGIAAFTNFPVTMTGTHGRRATPGALTAGGHGFSEAWISPT